MRNVTLVDGDPMMVALGLEPAMTATGRVIFEGADASARPAFSNVNMSLRSATSVMWGIVSSGVVDADGNFKQDGVFPSRFRLNATVSGTSATAWTMKSVTMSGRDVTDVPFDIGPGDAPSFVVTFTDQVSELSGSLVDPTGQPSTDYFVVVVSADRAHWLPGSRRIVNTRPDGRGHFVFRGLPPGEYRLAATTDLVARDLQDVAALEALLPQSLPVTIGLGEKKTIDIKVAGR